MWPTHDVFNQPRPLEDDNLFEGDQALQAALCLHAPGLDVQELRGLGQRLGTADMQYHARQANVHRPQLRTHDRHGHRIDEVEFYPSYHTLMAAAMHAGLHGTPFADEEQARGHAHLRRAAAFMMFTQLEPSTLCPISMTYAVTPALRANPAIHADWAAGLTSRAYDAPLRPWNTKTGLTMGMGMTEKQGGSDVRANTTVAIADDTDTWGQRYLVTGHKWFFSAPMSDAFLVLARTDAGPSCFFLPRVLPGGSRNRLFIQRLKDKLGNHANASAEVEFDQAAAWLVGDEGRGIPQILAMGMLTRLDCALGTAGLMRRAVALATDHCTQRLAFGKPLAEHPLMQNVLADMALESEAATALALRLAHCLDSLQDPREQALHRLLTPVAKFWVCKRGSTLAQEAMECLGGNGYVEENGEGVMARIYREMPVNSIWEGAGNIMALDLLRALQPPEAAAALAQELAQARGMHAALDEAAASLPGRLQAMNSASAARRLAQEVALAVQAALLARSAPPTVFAAFCDSRLAGHWGHTFGTLGAGQDLGGIVERARPR